MTTEAGEAAGTMKYFPFGECRNSQGNVATDRLFTGQRLDDTGLYYYGGRYYDPPIGRFISADTFVQWSNGFDVVSSQLTVNAIPAGLGIVFTLNNDDSSFSIPSNLISALAPGCNYPKYTLKAPLNPQALNRYSYVLNDPLRYNDPYGWWTFAIGRSFSLGGILGGSAGNAIIFDNHGNIGIANIGGGGAYGGFSGFLGITLQGTTAETIFQAEGLSVQSGFSTDLPNTGIASAGLSLGGEYVIGFGSESSYHGVDINIGIGAGLGPAEAHGFVIDTTITQSTTWNELGSSISNFFSSLSNTISDFFSLF